MADRFDRKARVAFGAYLFGSAILHVSWESLQLPLYTIWRTGTPREIAFAVVHCTAGDVLLAAFWLFAAVVVLGDREWPAEHFARVAVAAIAIGVGYTIYSEWLNVVIRKSWAYTELMPTLPVLGTGLSPVLQWLVIPSIALYSVGRQRPL